MTIRFTQDTGDIMAFQKYHFRSNPRNIRNLRMIKFLYPLVFIALAFVLTLRSSGEANLAVWIFTAVISIVWIIFSGRWIERMTLRRIRKSFQRRDNSILLGEREMSFDEDGIRIRTDQNDDLISWQSVTGTVREGNYIYIFLSETNAYLIPLRKISGKEAEELIPTLERFTTKGK